MAMPAAMRRPAPRIANTTGVRSTVPTAAAALGSGLLPGVAPAPADAAATSMEAFELPIGSETPADAPSPSEGEAAPLDAWEDADGGVGPGVLTAVGLGVAAG